MGTNCHLPDLLYILFVLITTCLLGIILYINSALRPICLYYTPQLQVALQNAILPIFVSTYIFFTILFILFLLFAIAKIVAIILHYYYYYYL